MFDDSTARRVGLSRLTGTRVSEVRIGSPASRAGIQTDDVILKFDGMLVDNDEHLINLVKRTEVGSPVPIEVFRGGSIVRLMVDIVRRQEASAAVAR